jgi:hypothetical protein
LNKSFGFYQRPSGKLGGVKVSCLYRESNNVLLFYYLSDLLPYLIAVQYREKDV